MAAAAVDDAACQRQDEVLRSAVAQLKPLDSLTMLQALLCHADGLAQAQARLAQALAQGRQAEAALRPELAALASAERPAGLRRGAGVSLSAGWTLTDFGARAAGVRAAGLAATAEEQAQAQARLAAIGRAADLLAETAAAQARHEAARANLTAATEAQRTAAARHRAGAGSPADALQIQRVWARARLDFVRTDAERQQVMIALAAALGLPADSTARLAIEPAIAEALAQEERVRDTDAAALAERHPALRAARHRLAEQGARIDAWRRRSGAPSGSRPAPAGAMAATLRPGTRPWA